MDYLEKGELLCVYLPIYCNRQASLRQNFDVGNGKEGEREELWCLFSLAVASLEAVIPLDSTETSAKFYVCIKYSRLGCDWLHKNVHKRRFCGESAAMTERKYGHRLQRALRNNNLIFTELKLPSFTSTTALTVHSPATTRQCY